MKKVFVSDVSLIKAAARGDNLTFRQKLNIVAALTKAGLNSVELPVLSDNPETAVVYKTIAESAENIIFTVNAGVTAEQIKNTYECVKSANDLCLQIALPVSTVGMEYIYHLKSDKMLEKIAALISEAKKYCNAVEFVALDATRSDIDFVCECAKIAAESGATAVTLTDTAGVFFPEEFADYVAAVKEGANIFVYAEPSDALQLGQACAVAAIKAGADGIKTSIKGSENITAEAFANIIRQKGEALGIETALDITAIGNIVKHIAESAAIEERSATNDIATLSADATLSDITAEIKALGYELSAEDNGKVYEEFRRVADKKQAIGKAELEAIIASSAMQVPSTYHLINYVVNSGNIINATANITLEKDGEQLSGVSIGDGPIDAAFHAIEQIIGHHYELDDFQIQAVTKGREAVGSSIIRLRAMGKLYSGNGVSTDIIGACIRAYINALNKIVYEEK